MPVIAPPAVDPYVLRAQPVRRLPQERDGQRHPVVGDLDRVDAVQPRGPDAPTPLVGTAHQLTADELLLTHISPRPSNTSSRRLAVERTT